MAEMMECDSKAQVIKQHSSFHLAPSEITLSRGSQLTVMRTLNAALCRGPHSKELWSPADSQH